MMTKTSARGSVGANRSDRGTARRVTPRWNRPLRGVAAALVVSSLAACSVAADAGPEDGLASQEDAATTDQTVVFDETFASGWGVGGWQSTATVQSSIVKSGSKAIRATWNGAWAGVAFETWTAGTGTVSGSTYSHVQFYINPGATVTAAHKGLVISTNNTGATWHPLSAFLPATGLVANTWTLVRIPLSAINDSGAAYNRIAIMNNGGASGFSAFIDDVRLEKPSLGDTCGATITSGSGTLTTSDGASHTYYYRIPATAAPLAGRPVLIWLHGDGGTGSGTGTGFYPHTDPDGTVVVTPSGANKTWTHAAGDIPGKPQDAQFLSKLMDRIVASGLGCAKANPKRIYVGGDSRGAFMPYYLLQRASTKDRIAAVAANAGLLYCQSGDSSCNASTSMASLHASKAPMLHLHGTNDTAVSPPPTAAFHSPVDWNVDWRVFFPMKLWAEQNGCYSSSLTGGKNNGVARESFAVGSNTATRYDLSGFGAACSKYQLVLVPNGGHVIGGQHARIWSFLKQHTL